MIKITCKTKTNETFTCEASSFSYQLYTEEGTNGPQWNFSGLSSLKEASTHSCYNRQAKC
ncbi:MAG: hypothetical protein LBQ88_15520 [Treponema sp.]|jgi:hypothetical protein|nr:hypothetical protein [Treponema sp.]